MDLKTVLTSGVIAAVITGLISFISAMVSSNKEAQLSRITDERKAWREEIRRIAEELSIINIDNDKDKLNLIVLLTKLKIRINSRGFLTQDSSNELDYLKDSHIWNSIHILEQEETHTNKKLFNNEIRKLINYLSALLKYDWERSKLEVKINTSQIIGYGIYAISNGILVYCAYNNFNGTEFKDVLMLVSVFLVMFFSPDLLLLIYRIVNLKRDWANIVIPYGIAILIYGVLIFSATNIQDGTEALILPMILQLIAIIFIVISQYKNHKNNSDYIKEISKIKETK